MTSLNLPPPFRATALVEKSERRPAANLGAENESAIYEALKAVKTQRDEVSKLLNAQTQKLAHIVCDYLNASVNPKFTSSFS